jgi:phage terminase large subunit
MSATLAADPRTEKARATLRRWREDPVAFVRENFHVEPDAWQVEALRLFPHNQRLALKACKGPGKTAFKAWIIWNFLATRPHPKIAATSITEDNLSDGLWTELAKWQRLSPFLREHFTWTKTRVFCNDAPETWFAAARTWPKSADPTRQADTLAGLHADYILFVIDEAGSIPQAIVATAEAALATGIETRLVIGGNPTDLAGPLYAACVTHRHLWSVVEITGDPDNPERSSRIDLQWARDQIGMYGRDNPWVMVNVLGQFPPSSLNALLGPEDVKAAMARTLERDVYGWAQVRLGIDVARYGDDRTVIFPRQGRQAFAPSVMRHARGSSVSTDIATAVLAKRAEFGGTGLMILDATGGWAAGASDVLKTSGTLHTDRPVDVQFHGASGNDKYRNRRAEMWFGMAEWVKSGGALPNLPELVGELTTPTYTFVNGKFLIEPKDQVKERLGRSPDLADALALTFALPEGARPVKPPQPPSISSGFFAS